MCGPRRGRMLGAMKSHTLICLAGLALAAAPAAEAAPAKQAAFKATITGSQVLTWSYDTLATGACDGNNHAGGSVGRSRERARPAARRCPRSVRTTAAA
jgi:hypothetical protein